MELRTFRAPTMHEALAMVRRRVGPRRRRAAHPRGPRRICGWFPGPRQIEVTASCEVNVPSRLPPSQPADRSDTGETSPVARRHGRSRADTARPAEIEGQLSQLQGMVQELCRRSTGGGRQRSARRTVSPLHRPLGFRSERRIGPRTGRTRPQREPRRRAGRSAAGEGWIADDRG